MPSFFKKPAWAATAGGDPDSEFYRRSEQTYSDIVAANREASKKPKVQSEDPNTSPVQADKKSKRPRISNEPAEESISRQEHSPPVESLERRDKRPSVRPADGHTEPESTVSQENDSLRSTSTRASSSPSLHKSPADHLEPPPAEQEADAKSEGPDAGPESTSHPSHSPAPLVEDPVVQILLTSEIPNTKPLLVHRKMSQALREVRQEWCRRQGFPEETHPSIHLTWMGRRLFDVTTCRSLGIKARGGTLPSSMDDDLVAGPKSLQIHMEAVTDNQQLLGQPNTSIDARSVSPPPNPPAEGNEPMKLILRSPGLDDLKIRARPTTRVSKIISAFRNKFEIAANREVYLVFDGDRLDPDTTLQEHDIADLDLVDVQIK